MPAGRRARRDRPGLVRQDSAGALHPLVPVGRQLSLPRSGSRRAIRDDVLETLRTLGLADPRRTAAALPAELFGGQRQRVCLALALAALGFLGLGSRPPSPEWGLVLSEGAAYIERAPWTVLAPTAALVLVAVLAVSLSATGRAPTGAGGPGRR